MAWSNPRTWVPNEVVTSAHMNQEVRDNLNALFPDGVTNDAWTVTLEATSANPSTSSAAGRQYQTGAMLDLYARFILSSAPSGRLFVTLPETVVNLVGTASEGAGQTVGSWTARDDSVGIVAAGSTILRSTTEIQFALGGSQDAAMLSDFVPWTWQSGDVLSCYARIPIA